MTTSGTVSTMLTATVTIGTTTANWQVDDDVGVVPGLRPPALMAGTLVA